jgi:flavin reductase (DIM6/NTAB) family NADH-FMN oxidoreductase RutF
MRQKAWVDARNCDRRALRDMLGSFMTGVTVVAACDARGTPSALTAISFTSVSLDPPLILVCLAKSSRSAGVVTRSEHFSVNILGDWQREISSAFASRSPARDVALDALTPGMPPVLDDSLATMSCTRHQVVDAGDHMILIGVVTQFSSMGGEPLGYFRGGYAGLGVVHAHGDQEAPVHVEGTSTSAPAFGN